MAKYRVREEVQSDGTSKFYPQVKRRSVFLVFGLAWTWKFIDRETPWRNDYENFATLEEARDFIVKYKQKLLAAKKKVINHSATPYFPTPPGGYQPRPKPPVTPPPKRP